MSSGTGMLERHDPAGTEPTLRLPVDPMDQPPVVTRRTDRRAPRRRRTFTGFIGGLVILALTLVGGVVVLGRVVSLPDLNPFDKQTVDRTQPPVLESIRDLHRFTAAEGTFQVVVDLQHDRKYVPDFLLNERTLFIASGAVDAYVDLGDLASGAVVVGQDKSVTITLPEPELADPSLDVDKSYVFSEKRGLVNRVQDAFGSDSDRQAEVYRSARSRLAKAATATELVDRAEANTRSTLVGLLRGLGYTDVTINFAD